LPPGFPSTHSRIRPTPSKFVIDAIENRPDRSKDPALSAEDERKLDEILIEFDELLSRR